MTIQTALSVDLVHEAESSYGVKPAASGGRLIRRTASTLSLGKDILRSSELRADAQQALVRHGLRRVQGEIAGELALADWDGLLGAALRGAWNAGAAFAAAPGSGVTAGASAFGRAGGSWLDDGFRIGDVVRWSGLSSGNDGRNLRIVGLTGATMTVAETVEAVTAAVETCSCAVAGRKLLTGTQRHSFTIEQRYGDAGFSQVFTGCRVARMELSLPPTRLAEIRLAILGKDMEIAVDGASPYFTAPAAPAGEPPLAAVDAVLRVGGGDLAVVTGLDLSVDSGLGGDAVVGAATVPEIIYGRTAVSGVLTAFVTDAALLQQFEAEAEASLHLLLAAPGSEPRDFLALHLPRLTFTGGEIRHQDEHALPIRLPFTALPWGGGGAEHDQATMVIQRSNA